MPGPAQLTPTIHELEIYGTRLRMNPTGTVAALAYRAAEGIVNHYLKNPGNIIATK